MTRFLIWGTGGVALSNYKAYKKIRCLQDVSIIGFVDNNSKKWGMKIEGVPILAPADITRFEWDYICIFSSYKEQILAQLVNELHVSREKVKNIFEPYIEQLKKHYANTEDKEIINELQRIENEDYLKVYHFIPSYEEILYEAFYDDMADLYYVLFENKRLYLKRGYNFLVKGDKKYLKDIWYEQDANSPHLYQERDICVNEGDILVDCGVCEGNFSLHNIDKINKLYLIECDEGWIEALHYTFAPYKDKVVYCNKFLSDTNSEKTITLDTLIKEPVDFIKMDIEGEELNALDGAKQLLSYNNLKCSICCYHRHGDEEKIRQTLESHGFVTETSKGYMLFLHDEDVLNNPELRRGIIRGKK